MEEGRVGEHASNESFAEQEERCTSEEGVREKGKMQSGGIPQDATPYLQTAAISRHAYVHARGEPDRR